MFFFPLSLFLLSVPGICLKSKMQIDQLFFFKQAKVNDTAVVSTSEKSHREQNSLCWLDSLTVRINFRSGLSLQCASVDGSPTDLYQFQSAMN